MEFMQLQFWIAALEIIWINILLSGDNAVVIALACQALPPRQRRWGMILGAGVAVGLRIAFTGVVAHLMAIQFLKIIGGLLLLWIAVKLVVPEEEPADSNVESVDNLWRAVRIVAIADLVMSLDNVIAIAAAAKGSLALIIFGLVVSVPLIIAGSAMLMAMLDRFPAIVWFGAALLGWVAGEIITEDPFIVRYLGSELAHQMEMFDAAFGASLVVGTAWVLRRRRAAEEMMRVRHRKGGDF